MFKVFSILLIGSISAQNEAFYFDHITVKEGLTNRYNSFIKKDSKGFVWISSLAGVYRFDGLDIKRYTTDEGLSSNNIQSNFFEDKRGNVWFTTIDALHCYYPKKDTIAYFRLRDENKDTLNHAYHLFHIDVDDRLWLKIGAEIYTYDLITHQERRIIETNGYRFAVGTTNAGNVKMIVACPWEMKTGIELLYLDDNIYTKKKLLDGKDLLKSGQVLKVSKAIIDNHLLWLFSDKGLVKYDWKKEKGNLIKLPSMAGQDKVIDGLLTNEQEILAISKNSGLWLFDRKSEKFIKNFNSSENISSSLSSNSLREIYLDEQDHLWISNFHTAAVDYTWINWNSFYNPLQFVLKNNLVVNSIIEDQKGHIWCSTEGKGIYEIDVHGKIVSHYKYKKKSSSLNGNLSPIKQLSIDDKGIIWAVGNNEVYNLVKNSWEVVYHLQKKFQYNMLHLSNNRKLIVTNEGIISLKKEDQKWEVDDSSLLEKELYVFKAFKDSQNRIYLPQSDKKILIYSYENEHLRLLKQIEINTSVYAICEHKNEIYLGTQKGMLSLMLDSLSVSPYDFEDKELNNTSIFSIQKDNNGFLWLATTKGLIRYNSEKNEKRYFQVEDGLVSTQFSHYSNLKTRAGQIYLGTDKGIVAFQPDSIQPYPYDTRIHLDYLKINEELYINPNGFVVDELRELDLKYNQNTLEFGVKGLSNYIPELTEVQYLLESYHSEWQSELNGEPIKFLKLPSGNYKLKLRGMNANGLHGRIRTIKVKIKPPFWETLWFQGLMFLLTLGVVRGVIRSYYNRKLKKQEEAFIRKEEEFKRKEEMKQLLQNERNRIAEDMHDDLGSGLNSIRIWIQKLQGKPKEEDIVGSLNKIEDKATNLVESMREIVWAMDSDSDNLPDLVAYMRRYVVAYLDEHDLACKSKYHDFPNIIVSGKKRRNIFLSIKEAAHNIVKHAKASEVKLSFNYNNETLQITLNDNGKGIDFTQKEQFGNGLKNMKNRMEQIGGSFEVKENNGCTLIFSIPLEEDNELLKSP